MLRSDWIVEFLHVVGTIRKNGGNPLKLHLVEVGIGEGVLRYDYALLRGLLDMPGKNKKNVRTNFRDLEFINYKFDAHTKAEFEAWFSSKGNGFLKDLHETLVAQYKLSLSWDDEHECFIGAMTGKEESLNAGKCITIRSAEWLRALAALAYVNIVIFSGEIWTIESTTDMV